MDTFKKERGIPGVVLLLLGEFQSVAEDLESRLFITESTCLGRLTVEREHLPKKSRERHTDVHTGHMAERMRRRRESPLTMNYIFTVIYPHPPFKVNSFVLTFL